MKLFKTKEEPCCKSLNSDAIEAACERHRDNGIKILGSGCKKCVSLEEATKKAVQELDLNVEVSHITDFAQIASYGVMTTPALVVNGKVTSYGKVLSVEEVKQILKKELQ